MCKPFIGTVVEKGGDLPTNGSLLFALIEPSGGIRAHSTAPLGDRRPVVFLGTTASDSYWDEATGTTVTLPSGWVQFGLPA